MKKIFAIFILFTFLVSIVVRFNFLVNPSYAQTTYGTNNPILPATEPGVPQDMHTFVHGLFINILSVGICFAAGFDPLTPDHKCLTFNSQSSKLGYNDNQTGGILGMETKLIGGSFNLPIHALPYFQFLSYNFHNSVVHKTYAAGNANEVGVGAQGLDPLLKLWVGMRNIAYLFIVIIFVIIGVMIMLRIKIDPRTVMTLQNQIPKIIIGLILITFSFAIAGLLIDLTYVITLMFLNVVAQAIGDSQVANGLFTAAEPIGAVDQTFSTLGLGGISGASWAGANVAANVAAGVIGNVPVIGGIVNLVLSLIWLIPNIICTIGSWVGSGCSTNWNGTYDTLSLIIYFAILAAVIIALFRFWISLINAYITILFTVILSPLRILLGGLPGAPGGGFGGFMRDMLANLLIFPACLGYIFLAGEMAKTISASVKNGSHPFVLPMVPGFDIGPIIALAAILMLPKIPDVVKESLKSKDVFGSAVGQALAPGVAASTNAAGQGMKSLFRKEDPMRGQKMGAGRALIFKIPGAKQAYEGISRTVTQNVGGS